MLKLPDNSIGRFIRDLYILPLALTSYLFVKYARIVMRRKVVVRREDAEKGEKKIAKFIWCGWSDINSGGKNLLTSMIVCPRWNPHAVQHSLGPLGVNYQISVNIKDMSRSCKIGILSVYKEGREVKTFSISDIASNDDWAVIPLSKGIYSLFIRYYQSRHDGVCPRLTIDSKIEVSSASINKEVTSYIEFMNRIKNKRGMIYYFLHCHVFTMLRYRQYLDESAVIRSYLPYGNPDTAFYFDMLDSKDQLSIDLGRKLQDKASVHIVFFNKWGFPIDWDDITFCKYLSPPFGELVSYLVRVIGVGNNLNDEELSIAKIERSNSAESLASRG